MQCTCVNSHSYFWHCMLQALNMFRTHTCSHSLSWTHAFKLSVNRVNGIADPFHCGCVCSKCRDMMECCVSLFIHADGVRFIITIESWSMLFLHMLLMLYIFIDCMTTRLSLSPPTISTLLTHVGLSLLPPNRHYLQDNNCCKLGNNVCGPTL